MSEVQPALIPVNMPAEALSAQVAFAGRAETAGVGGNVPSAPEPFPPPESIPSAETLSTWEQESYEIAPSLAASVGFPLWGVTLSEKLRVMIFGTSRYTDVLHGNFTYRYGVAIRVMLEILDSENQAKLSIPAIAAQVELDMVQANSQLIVSGYVGKIGSQLPKWQTFDVNTYASYLATVSSLQSTIFDDNDNIKPVLLGSTLASKLTTSDTDFKKGSFLSHILHP